MTTVLSNQRSQPNTTSSSSKASTSASEETRSREKSDQLIGDVDKSSQKDTSDGEPGHPTIDPTEAEKETAELVKKARSILEYTGLGDTELDQRVEEFERHNEGQSQGRYKERDIISESLLINDPVFKTIKLHPLLERIMNTPEFYRLKNIKQLGGACHVYPGANHTRFEHSLGVAYIAGQFVRHLRDQHPKESTITPEDILCVEVAALCHDLGQGPFSHLFESMILKNIVKDEEKIKNWCAKMSVLIWRKILQDHCKVLSSFVRSGLDKQDVVFIEEMIDHEQHEDTHTLKGREDEKQFLYEIVRNRTAYGVDADIWDCLTRDSYYLGITINFQWRRLMELTYIVGGKGKKRHIGVRNKEANGILEVLHMKCSLSHKAYKHKTVHAVELMIAEAVNLCTDIDLIQVQPARFTETWGSADALLHIEVISLRKAIKLALDAIEEKSPKNYLPGYLSLTDSILEQIAFYDHHKINNPAVCAEESLLDKFVKAKELVYRLEHRMLYKVADFRTFPGQRKEVSNDKVARVKRLQQLVDNSHLKPSIKDQIAQWCKSEERFSPEDIHVEMVKISFGSDDDDETHPLDKIRFVSKYDLSKPNPNEFEKSSPLVCLVCPEEFFEYQLRIFTKKHGLKTNIVKEAFTGWYFSDNDLYEHPGSTRSFSMVGEVETFACGPEGDTFHLQKHGIKIIVPSGAIDKRTFFEFAVYLDGPFEFARDKRPVSPILWICTKPHIKKFTKPIEVVIPHIFAELSEKDKSELELDIVKADHSIDFRELGGSKVYTFKSVQDSSPVLSKGVGTISLYHCCYLCVQGKKKSGIAARAGFCLSQFQTSQETRATVTFCATYFLKTCLEALKEQFPTQTHSSPIPPKKFNFRDSSERDPYLLFSVEQEGITISMNPPHCKILASDIDFWKRDEHGLYDVGLSLLHQNRMYPPRVMFEVDCSSCALFKRMFKVTGCPKSYCLDVELTFPLISTQGATLDRLGSQELMASRTSTVPEFSISHLYIFKCYSGDGARPIAYKAIQSLQHLWRDIAHLLGVEDPILKPIEAEFKEHKDRLVEVMKIWINKQHKREEYVPSWEGLCTLLDDIEQGTEANKLRGIIRTFQQS